MSSTAAIDRIEISPIADTTLKASAALWFLTAVAGQWIFACYVLAYYGGAALQGDFQAWNNVLPQGIIDGEPIGNAAMAAHLLVALIVSFCGALQLVPQIRARAPAFHRWNGRVYLFAVVSASLSGFYMVWTRGSASGPLGDVIISINGVLILAFAALALRYAIARKIDTHRRWALRLYLVANGVWFFRIGLMLWLLVHKGPVGFDPETFRGPFLTFLGLAQFLFPLAVLELYFRARDSAGAPGKYTMAAVLLALTVAMGAGIFAATMGLWLPRLSPA